MKLNFYRSIFIFMGALMLTACDFACSSSTPTKTESAQAPVAPAKVGISFDENYAYDAIIKYEKFGPKVPGNAAHKKTGDWIVAELKNFGATVLEQKSTATTFDGKTIPVRNIIAQTNPTATQRYLLSAHWDNRPFADQDVKDRTKPILGTNDGGSGVVVLLGIAKALQGQNLSVEGNPIGIDFAFWDAEDWGNPKSEEGWCIGSKYWAAHPVPENYHAEFGINYDMVGRIGSVFPIEPYSFRKGPEVLRKLHEAAKVLGYQDYFPNYTVGQIIDDHYYVTEGRGFPMVDLIYMTPSGMFPPEWHTHHDTSEVISRDVLKAVAQTSIQALFTK